MKKKLSINDKAEIALKEAVDEVIMNHKKSGRPLIIWKNGKVTKVSAEQILRNRK
jgi:hypothetical protein